MRELNKQGTKKRKRVIERNKSRFSSFIVFVPFQLVLFPFSLDILNVWKRNVSKGKGKFTHAFPLITFPFPSFVLCFG